MKNWLRSIIVSFLLLFATFATVGFSSWTTSSATGGAEASWSEDAVVAYYLNNTSKRFTRVEKALEQAQSGDIVCLVPATNNNFHDTNNKDVAKIDQVTYKISRSCEIKEGVTFVLPTDKASISSVTNSSTLSTYITDMEQPDGSKGSASSYSAFATASANKYLRVTLQIADGITLTNNGTLVVSGYLSYGSSGGGTIGHTSHSYSRIQLGRYSKIVQNNANAKTYCYGYISEMSTNNGSTVSFNSGTLYIPFIVNDYKGFSYSWAMTDGAIDTYGCSPFNQFEMRNIDAAVVLYFGASVYGKITFYVSYSTQGIDKKFNQTLNVLGTSSSFVFQLTDSTHSRVEYKYSTGTSVSKIKIYGGMTLNNFQLTLKESIVSVNLSTTKSYFPFSYRQDIELLAADGQATATFTATTQMIKLLPGSKMKIGDNAVLNGKSILVYTSFYDGSLAAGYSSPFSGSVTYPLKEGAVFEIADGGKVSTTNFAGTVYCDGGQLTYTNGTIKAYEPWSLKGSGSISPAWTIYDFLEVNETMQKVALSFKDKKKFYVGVNTFKVFSSFVPAFFIINTTTTDVYQINKYQKVLFFDDTPTLTLDPTANIYKFFSNKTYYKKASAITYNATTPFMCAVNSVNSISSDASGTNEFNVQSLTVTCSTPLVDGKPPLYVGKSIKLVANIVDINKVYDKTVSWESSNPAVATVDSSGNVTGVSLGTAVITATCDGVSGTFAANVIEEATTDAIESIYITDNKGASSLNPKTMTIDKNTVTYHGGQYSNGTTVTLTAHINPASAPYKSIKWVFNASAAGRQYVNDNTLASETVENSETLVCHVVSGSGASADTFKATLTVVGLDDSKFTATFIMVHKADVSCFQKGTSILMGDGTRKNIEDIDLGDTVMTWNFFTGQYEPQAISFYVDHGETDYEVLDLRFSDGTNLSIISDHGVFDYDENRYVYLNSDNFERYIGHSFAQFQEDDYNIVTLVEGSVSHKTTNAYSLTSAFNYNAIANDMFTAPPPGDFYNWIEMSDKLQYDLKQFNDDVATYGLYDYSVFEPYISYDAFIAYNGAYLKIAVEKGYFTFEYIVELINMFGEWMI
ncbi:MAG: Ig-like domain-containing protein [Bacilli bacterium]|nr:Ig-like domain-containing protein [Bacilli bacterium]